MVRDITRSKHVAHQNSSETSIETNELQDMNEI
jgi:hypothetical protein